jgi:hypothetical protein
VADDNNIKLKATLDFDDKSLRDAKKELEEIAKASEGLYKNRRAALHGGGRLSPTFQKYDADLNAVTKRYHETQSRILKLQDEFEKKSQPGLKRTAGWFHKVLYGEKISSDAEAQQEERKLTRRMDAFNRNLHGTLALTSHLASTLAPLPGGGILHSAFAGAAQGYGNSVAEYNENRLEAGEKGSAGGRFVAGMGGALKTAAIATALLAMAKAVAGAVQGSRESEKLNLAAGQAASGDLKQGRALFDVATHAPGFTAQEAMPIVAGASRAGGGVGAAQAALRAELVAGQGGAFNQLTGGLAQSGGKGIDENARRLWIDINATAMAQGLQKGRIGELISGAMQVAAARSAGVTSGDPSNILRMAAGMGGAYTGRRGFETIGRLESFTKGESSPMANAMSLMANGLGTGSSYVQAKMGAEKGLFGAGADANGLKKRIAMLSDMTGGDQETTQMLLAHSAGLGMTEAGDVLKQVQSGKFGEKEFGEFQAKADKTEQEAWNAMAKMDWKTIDQLLEAISFKLGELLRKLGGLEAVEKGLTLTLKGVDYLVGLTMPSGIKSMRHLGTGNDTTFGEDTAEYKAYMKGKAPTNVHSAYQELTTLAERGGKWDSSKPNGGLHTDQVLFRAGDGTAHVILELRDSQNTMLFSQELDVGSASAPAQSPKKRAGKTQ